ncbi:MAG: PQQ-binding-like beta-propeller repeat protein [Acidobacteriota bacterium]
MRLSTSTTMRGFVITLLFAFVASVSLAEDTADWTQWGGPDRNFMIAAEGISWPADGPKELWSRDLGDGYSSILAKGDRIYTMYRTAEGKEAVIALDAKTGKTVWEHAYEAEPHESHVHQFGDGPRATPLIVGDRIYTVGVSGILHALELKDGSVAWKHNLWTELGGSPLNHGYSSSPIEYGDTIIVLNGGQGASVVAFNKADGSVAWKNHDFTNSYSAPQILEVNGQPQLITYMAKEVVGLDPSNGELLWRYEIGNQFGQNISMPVLADDGQHLFISVLQAGGRGLKLTTAEDGKTSVEEAWTTRKIQLYHVTTVRDGDWVYGVTGGRAPHFMAAVNIKTGDIGWRERGFTKTQCVGVGDKIVAIDEEGNLLLMSVSPEGVERHGSAQVLEQPSWTVPTVVGTTVYVRDKKTIKAVSLG